MICIIPLAYAALGAFTVVVQTVLLREFFVVAAGNELSFGIAMAGWLLGVGAGSLTGALFSARRRETALPFARAALILCAVAPLTLAVVRNLHSLGAAPQGMLMPLSRSFYLIPLLSLPFCALSGFVFPLAAGLRPIPERKAAGAMAGAYAWESLGAMVGGTLYTFLLVGRLDPITVTALLALPLLAASWALSRRAVGGKRIAAASLATALFLLILLSLGISNRFESWLTHQRWKGISSSRLIASRDTPFQNLQLGSAHGQYTLFSNGQLAAVFPDEEENELMAAMLLTQHPRPLDVLVIGDVAGGLGRHLLRYPLASLTAVEIDARVTEMIGAHQNPESRRAWADPRFRQRIMDGRRFVLLERPAVKGDEKRRFDVIFIHQPDAWTAQLNRYYTREFFLNLQKILSPGGTVALRLASAENYASEIVAPYTATIYKTLKSVFPFIALSPGMTNLLFASDSRLSVTQDPAILTRRYQTIAPSPARLASIFPSLYPAEKIAYIRTVLCATPIPSLNLDDRPIGYFLGSRLLGWSTGSPLPGFFTRLERFTLPTALLAMAVLLLPLLLWVLLRRRNGIGAAAAVLASACGGFAGLSFEITAIFVFQNAWGFVYQAVGMLIALFMAGLGAGAAWASHRIGKKNPSPRSAARSLAGVLALISIVSAAFLLMRPGVRPEREGQFLLAAALCGMGLLVGAILPLGLRILDHLPAGKGGGFLNAGDYLGGAAGSVLTAAFFLPLLGMTSGLLLIALTALAAALVIFVSAIPTRKKPEGRSRWISEQQALTPTADRSRSGRPLR